MEMDYNTRIILNDIATLRNEVKEVHVSVHDLRRDIANLKKDIQYISTYFLDIRKDIKSDNEELMDVTVESLTKLSAALAKLAFTIEHLSKKLNREEGQ